MSNVIYDRKALNNLNALYSSKVKRNPNYKLSDFYDEVDKGNMIHEDILFYKDTEGYDELEIVVRNKQLQVSREQKSLLEELNEVSEEELLEDLKELLPNVDNTPKVVKEEKAVELKSNIDVINVDKGLTTKQQINSIQSQLDERKTENTIKLETKENIFNTNLPVNKKEIKVEKIQEANKNLLDMFDDLDNLYKVDDSVNGTIKKNLLLADNNIGNTITEKVILPVSSYTAYMSGLSMSDKITIKNTNRNDYDLHAVLFRMIYNHIVEMEPKKPDYATWKKITAFNDLKVLYYGLYAATYRQGNEYDIKCDNEDCGEENRVITNTDSIVQVEDENIFNKINDITTKVRTFEDIGKISELGVTKRVKLPLSNIIIEFKNPSLDEYLEYVKNYPREDKRYRHLGEIYELIMFTSKIFIVNKEETEKTGKLCVYEPFTQVEDFVRIYSNKVDISEDELLVTGINELVTKYLINYQIPKFSCTKCGHDMGPYPADPKDLLFPRLSR